ncbi:MAG: DUF2934 domain-containing protein [Hyphomicrobiales bacterium]|nr:DUF2934 domain-containing protein [Hyphomicrobiales bacterium]
MSKKIWEMTQEIQKRINEVAYMMWESAGRHQGMAMDYWLKAEREVLSTMQTAAERLIAMNTVNKEDAPPAKAHGSGAAEGESSASSPSPTAKPNKIDSKPAAAARPSASASKTRTPTRPRRKS